MRPVAIALFGSPSLIFHLGFDQLGKVDPLWYQQARHPYLSAIVTILQELATWNTIKRLEFLIATGDDPMLGLQVKLDRQSYSLVNYPSDLFTKLEPQTIYSLF